MNFYDRKIIDDDDDDKSKLNINKDFLNFLINKKNEQNVLKSSTI